MDNVEITLKLTLAEVNLVAAGLGKLPLETSINVWQSIQRQAQPQVDAATAANPPAQPEVSEAA